MRAVDEKIATAKTAVKIMEDRLTQIREQAMVLLETAEIYQVAIDETEERIERLEAQEAK